MQELGINLAVPLAADPSLIASPPQLSLEQPRCGCNSPPSSTRIRDWMRRV